MHTWYVGINPLACAADLTSHQDTWSPGRYPYQETEQSRVTHGTFFYLAQEEGLISNHSIHAGIRCKFGVRTRTVDVGTSLIIPQSISQLRIWTTIAPSAFS